MTMNDHSQIALNTNEEDVFDKENTFFENNSIVDGVEREEPLGPSRNPLLPEDRDLKEYLEAPFVYGAGVNESVVLSNGSLQYFATDFSLPGRNGFDFSVVRKYDSNNANLHDVAPIYDGTNMYSTVKRDNYHYLRNYGLGYGWQFVLPSIEITPFSERDSHFNYYPTLHLEDGRSIIIEDGVLKDYPLIDISISETTGTITHSLKTTLSSTYHLVVSYKNGNKDYFKKRLDANGNLNSYTLVARSDRFDNYIFFNMIDFGGMTVTDSWGRDISFTSSGNLMRWTLPDDSIISYQKNNNSLVSVTDLGNRTTSYSYYDTNIYSAVCRFASSQYGDNTNLSFSYLLLNEVTYPTGLVTKYEYTTTPALWTIGSYDGVKRFFPLSQRKDISNGSSYNTKQYQYTNSSDGKYFKDAKVTRLNGITEKHSFNDKGLLTAKEVRHNNELSSLGNYTYGTNTTAANYKLLVNALEKTYSLEYSGRYTEKETIYTYSSNKKADIIKIEESYVDDPSLDNVINMTYSDFSILTTKTVMKDSSTTIKEEYTLDSSRANKVISYARIYENSILKEKTQYIYNGSYLVTERRRYYSNNSNLESSNSYYSENYSYDSIYTHASTGRTVTGILDADGIITSSITDTIVYDLFGRIVSTTNALNHTTTYVYDKLGRKTIELYPDGATREYIYFDNLNHIVGIDENKNISRYEYTPLGQIYRVYLNDNILPSFSDILLTEDTYDSSMRLVVELTFDEVGAIRTETNYTYDSYDRVLTKSTTGSDIDYLETHEYLDLFIEQDKKYYLHKTTVSGNEDGTSDLVTSSLANLVGHTVKEYTAEFLISTYTYDKLGNTLTVTNAEANTTTFQYDYLGRVIKETKLLNNIPISRRTEYDSLGNKLYEWDYSNSKTS